MAHSRSSPIAAICFLGFLVYFARHPLWVLLLSDLHQVLFPLHFFQRLLYFSVITGGMSISTELFCFSVASWVSWQLYRSAHICSGTITIYCLFLMTLACLSLSEYMWFSTMPRRLFTAFRLPLFFRARSMNRFILNFRISACDAFWWTLKALLFLCCRLWLRLICFAVS